jgi:biotin carboxyl carrier protein
MSAVSSESPLNSEQQAAIAAANAAANKNGSVNDKSQKQQKQTEDGSQLSYDLSRSYGRNWTKTNVTTLFDWLTVAAFNMQCLDYAIIRHRAAIRNFTIYGLVVSTLSGTISLSQFGIDQGHISNRILQGIFTFFTFSLAIYTGYIKIYQIQERLEQYIKLRQDWAVFATTIGSELQLPIELRRDALHLIVKYKSTYLDLIKIDIEIPESLRVRAEQSLPKSSESQIQVMNLPSTIINIGIQELDDIHEDRQRNKDRYSVAKSEVAPPPAASATLVVSATQATPAAAQATPAAQAAQATQATPAAAQAPAAQAAAQTAASPITTTQDKPKNLTIHSSRDIIPPLSFVASIISPTSTPAPTPAEQETISPGN